MTIGEIIYTILIGPLELFFEVVFVIANRHVSNPAYAIILLSLAMNFLVLPLYRRADALQAEERDRENSLAPWIKHIKKTFTGDERFMMLQAFYRENNYKPTDSLKGSISLLLEIPFFIAAYHFLSHLETLKGVSFGPIADLGSPDALISIGTVTLNLLPILMTLINVVSAAIYMKGFPLKSKVQMYGIAVIFLVFLYKSPAGLVFYWTLNNLFSLAKNIFYKLSDPTKVLKYLSSGAGMILLVGAIIWQPMGSKRANLILIVLLLFMQLPILMHGREHKDVLPSAIMVKSLFLWSSISMTILLGSLIPSAVINDSTQEFINPSNYMSPFWYIASASALSAGIFLVWLRVFYSLSSEIGKQFFTAILVIETYGALINYMFFGKNYGNFSNLLTYDITPSVPIEGAAFNLIVLVLASAVICYVLIKKADRLKLVTAVIALSLIIMSGINIAGINSSLRASDEILKATSSDPEISLSKNGKNVVVIMMDRQIGHFIPFIMNEKPELKQAFAGFTNYSNSISFGAYTNFGAPGLYGGYDYIPGEMNTRDTESLCDKHNEALKVMPKIFSDAGYNVTVIEPTYAGYSWIPDLSIYDDIDNTKAYIANGKFAIEECGYEPASIAERTVRKRNIFCYGLFKTSPALFQPFIYNKGSYNTAPLPERDLSYTVESVSKSTGYKESFMKTYAVLCNMSTITHITESEENTFTMMSNDTTHEPVLLQEPEYTPSMHVDNTKYRENEQNKNDGNGHIISLDDDYNASHYETNMAAMIKLGEWLDYLKKNDVYDNTRIIIVSDHGRGMSDGTMPVLDYKSKKDDTKTFNTSLFDSTLMVKDFNSKEYTTKDTFTTNADTPAMAMEGLIEEPVNPYTGNPITMLEASGHSVEIIASHIWETDKNNGNTFIPADWFSVTKNIYDVDNWKYIGYR